MEEKAHIPNKGGFEAKWIEPNVEDLEKARSIICPSGSHVAPWYKNASMTKTKFISSQYLFTLITAETNPLLQTKKEYEAPWRGKKKSMSLLKKKGHSEGKGNFIFGLPSQSR